MQAAKYHTKVVQITDEYYMNPFYLLAPHATHQLKYSPCGASLRRVAFGLIDWGQLGGCNGTSQLRFMDLVCSDDGVGDVDMVWHGMVGYGNAMSLD